MLPHIRLRDKRKSFQMMLDKWNEIIFSSIKEKLQAAAMKLVAAERNGEAFDSQLVVGVRESYGNERFDESEVAYIKLASFKSTIVHPMAYGCRSC